MVLDASAVLEILLGIASRRLLARVLAPEETLHAPQLLDLEVIQVLRRYTLERRIDARRAREALEDFAWLPVARYPHDIFQERIWELRFGLTAYDAVYVALAEALEAPLVTRDARLAASKGHRARIELF